MLSSGAIYPVYQLMKDQGIEIDWADFLSVVLSYYSKDGNLYSMPFNSSTAILYYNRTIFKKAGLDPTKAPKTYEEIEKAAKACVKSGATKIGFTTAWPSWTLVENAHAWHDQPFADQDNGFKGMASQLKINGAFGVKTVDPAHPLAERGDLHLLGPGEQGRSAHHQRGGGHRPRLDGARGDARRRRPNSTGGRASCPAWPAIPRGTPSSAAPASG